MSRKSECDKLVFKLLKTVLSSRIDCATAGNTVIHEACSALKNSRALPCIPFPQARCLSRHRKDDKYLAQIIETLAIVNRAIDCILRDTPYDR